MPTPNPDESRDDFVTRCTPIVIDDGTAKDSEQAVAVCNSMFEDATTGEVNASLSNKRISVKAVSVNLTAAKGDETRKGPAKFDVVAYTGGAMMLDGFDLPVVVDLSGLTYASTLTANLDHKSDQLVGHITDKINDGKQLLVSGFTSAATPYRDTVVHSALDGFPWKASIEAETQKVVTVGQDKTVTVNSQKFTGPIHVARKATLFGVAFVGHGADDNTTVSIAAKAASSKKEIPMSEFETWIEAEGFEVATINEKQRSFLKATYDERQAVKARRKVEEDADGDSLGKIINAERSEYERRTKIKDLIRAAIKGDFRYKPQHWDDLEEMGEKAIRDCDDPRDVEMRLLKASRPVLEPHFSENHRPLDRKVIEAALCKAASMPNLDKHFSPDVLETVDRNRELKNFGLQQLLIKCAAANGYDAHAGERVTSSNLRRVLRHAFMDDDGPRSIRAAQFSTISIPGILGAVANKEILAGFTEEDASWREISRIASVPDFKTMTAYRLTDSLEYELVPKGGEIKHGTLGEETYTRSIDTYAKMLGLTRQDIINDDLGSLDDLRTRLGRGAARKFNNVFWTAFMSNLATTFTTARGNYLAGATTNLGTDGVGLGLGVSLFRALESSDGKRIGGTPTILLVPPELEVNADRLYTGGGADAQTVANTNVFKGKYRPVVVPWLSDTSFTGNSTTAWYLFRDPGILAVMVVSFLNGQQTPTVDSTEADFETLGILFRGYHDFGANVAEYLAGVMLKGAA